MATEITAETAAVDNQTEQQAEQSQEAFGQLVEEKILRYFQNKEIANERKEENKMLFEEIEHFFEQMQEDELIFQLPNGEYAVLSKKATIREVLDKEALAHELLIAKDELKTPFDFSMLTAKGKLTPDMISRHTETETSIRVRLSKRKTKPRKKR
ncbi:hypothetical protein [Effusibacillus dendaii]|uniref:Uncharacterized protein n=1 Tax=Effusibacillus dendaii TaxID=2743772 RepID=A0A7I8DBF0_9BACL|nr:hypothetical protein [Effusibacillus dendaii]BCJ86289.1 hypothetical protein skT53_12740 [Effusibacillus dendaii]